MYKGSELESMGSSQTLATQYLELDTMYKGSELESMGSG